MNAGSADYPESFPLAEWIREHGPAVRGYLFGMVRDESTADDLCQEVFQRVWRSRATYAEAGQTRAYLLRIADRLAIDHLRSRNRREQLIDDEAWDRCEPSDRDHGPVDSAERAETADRLLRALDCLTPAQRRILLMRFYSGLEFAEIATLVGCPLNTALSHCHRGLQSLRKILGPEE
ncbi:MAG: polymerase sigma factor SigW [Planctomycetota bacterium]|jgi:RNA polymerase sigma-70 factor (ECF subfamily)